jgi:hypothetical protein
MNQWRSQMRFNMTPLSVGLAAFALLLGTLASSSADAQSKRQQRARADQWQNGSSVWPRYTPREYVVCYSGCNNKSATVVLGADPDPNIRSQLQRDHGYFGGID